MTRAAGVTRATGVSRATGVTRASGVSRSLSLLAAAVLLGACSGAGPAGNGAAPTDGVGALDSALGGILNGSGGGAGTGLQPSGAKVQVFNAFLAPGAPPAPIDVYNDPALDSTSHPLVTVPYGQMSPQFDPGEFDTSGNTALTFMPAGVVDTAKELMDQSLTVKAGDVVTIFLTTAAPFDPGASYGGQTSVYFNNPGDQEAIATPPDGKGLLIVVSSGLDQTLASPTAASWYVSFGHGCEPGLGNGPGITAQVDPGTTGTPYDMAPGAITVTIHAEAPDSQASCSGTPIATANVTAKAGVTDVLLLYGTDGDIHAELVPLE